MNKRFKSQLRDRVPYFLDVLESILTRQDNPIDSNAVHDFRACRVVHRHLGRSVNLESRIHFLNQPDDSDILDDCCVNSPVDRLSEKTERIFELVRLDQRVEREIDPDSSRVSESASGLELIERELSALVAGVIPLRAEVHGVSAVSDGGSHSIERARRRKKFRNLDRGHASI